MSAPKRIWMMVRDSDGALGPTSSKSFLGSMSPGWAEREYRLVEPKREVLAYVVKRGDKYADGDREWVPSLRDAWRFDAENVGDDVKRWRRHAKHHAATFASARVVRLVRKAKP